MIDWIQQRRSIDHHLLTDLVRSLFHLFTRQSLSIYKISDVLEDFKSFRKSERFIF